MNEIETAIDALKEGKQFYTRFQEDEWGIAYESGNTFVHWWSTGHYMDRKIQTKIIDEAGVRKLMTSINKDKLIASLYNRKIYPHS